VTLPSASWMRSRTELRLSDPAGRKVVQHDHLMTFRDQLFDQMRTMTRHTVTRYLMDLRACLLGL